MGSSSSSQNARFYWLNVWFIARASFKAIQKQKNSNAIVNHASQTSASIGQPGRAGPSLDDEKKHK